MFSTVTACVVSQSVPDGTTVVTDLSRAVPTTTADAVVTRLPFPTPPAAPSTMFTPLSTSSTAPSGSGVGSTRGGTEIVDQVVDWRQSVCQESRDRFVQRIIEAMSLNHNHFGAPFRQHSSDAIGLSDHVVGHVVDHARTIERDMFDTAVSRHDYHVMIAEKIALLVKNSDRTHSSCMTQNHGFSSRNCRIDDGSVVASDHGTNTLGQAMASNGFLQTNVIAESEMTDDTRASSRYSVDRRARITTGNNSDSSSCLSNEMDVNEPNKSASVFSVADDVVVVDVAVASIQTTTPSYPPALDLSQPRPPSQPTRASKVPRRRPSNRTQSSSGSSESMIDLTQNPRQTITDFIDLTTEPDEFIIETPSRRKISRIDDGSPDTVAPPSVGNNLEKVTLPSSILSPLPLLPFTLWPLPPLTPLSVSDLGRCIDQVATAVDKPMSFQPLTVRSELSKYDSFNQSRRGDSQQVAIGTQSHCQPIPTSSIISTGAETVQRQPSCAVIPATVPTICVEYMLRKRGSMWCPLGGSCDRYHSKNEQPYQWQRKRTSPSGVSTSSSSAAPASYGDFNTDVWIDFGGAANTDIEHAFCDESNCSFTTGDTEQLKWNSTVTYCLDFEQMTFGEVFVGGHSPLLAGKIRRLQVAENDIKPAVDVAAGATNNRETSHGQYMTVWQWFWFNDITWQAYESKAMMTAAGDPSVSSDTAFRQQQMFSLTTGYVFSETIEQAYSLSPLGMFSFSCLHPVDHSAYAIDFQRMVQMNQSTGRCRPIRRRPAWQLPGRPPTPVEAVISTVVRFPPTWNMSLVNDDVRYQLVTVLGVGSTAVEYNEVVALFRSTLQGRHGNVKVKSVRRVQNRSLWEKFAQFRSDAERTRRNPIAVRRLFHGTKKQYVEAICANGFDWRLSGTSSGSMYGRGSYFARDASYSFTYTDCRKMFIVQVAVGDFTLGGSSVIHPPPKDPSRPFDDFYDSCVDDVNNPSIFVTFDRCQSYPEYIIEY